MSDGAIAFHLTLRAGQIVGIDIRNPRQPISALLIGKTPEQALELIPLLYGICRQSHRFAALQALRFPADDIHAAQILSGHERLTEHLSRLLLDWPSLIGLPRLEKSFVNGYQALHPKSGAVSTENIMSVAAELREHFWGDKNEKKWLLFWSSLANHDEHSAALMGLAESADNPCLQILRHLLIWDNHPWVRGFFQTEALPLTAEILTALSQSADRLFHPKFARVPQLGEADGLACCHVLPLFPESSTFQALRRLFARHPLSALYLAKIADVWQLLTANPSALIARDDRGAQHPTTVDCGLSATSRGLLGHFAEVENNTIKSYTILAPTEWNFHPKRWQGLIGQAWDEADAPVLEALLLTMDACVPVTTKVFR